MATQITTTSPYCNLVRKKLGASESQSKASDTPCSIWKAKYLYPSAEPRGRGGDTQQ